MKKTKRGFTLIELMITLAILAILACMVFGAMGGCSVSDGVRTGTIAKFSSKGLFIKSHEGELIMGGVRDTGDSISANVWSFSCLKPDLYPVLEKAAEHGDKVSLKYHQTALFNPFTRDTSYLIVDVTVITNR